MINSIYKNYKIRLKNIWKKPICNQKSNRAPKCCWCVFLLCYRCTWIVIGWLIATLTISFYTIPKSYILLLLFTLPCAVDWLLQKLNLFESTNPRRFITGLLFWIWLIFL